MKQTILSLLLALCALAGTANTAQAATKTYIFEGQQGGSAAQYTGYFYAEGSPSTHYASSPATWTYNSTSSLSFTLADGITLTLSSSTKQLLVHEGLGAQGQATLNVSGGSTYYIYHVRLFDASGNLIQFDASGNQVTSNGTSQADYWNMTMSINKTYPAPDGIVFKKIEISYAEKIPFSDAEISGIDDSYIVSDAAVTPEPTVTWHGTTLNKGTHYAVSYQNNSNAGTATVTATGKTPFGSTQKTKDYTLIWATYTVRFNKNHDDATGTMSNQAFTYNTAQALAANAFTRTGYTFSGWSTTPSGSVAYTNGQTVTNLTATDGATVDLYAQWTAVTYTLRLHHNDGTDGYTDMAMTYDVAKNIQSVSRTGYVLAGWNTQADGNGTSYAEGQSVSNLTATDGATVDLYAQWANPSGTCGASGSNATWVYDHATTTLTISGSGEMRYYAANEAPWQDYNPYITTVSIGSGITAINGLPFIDCIALTTVNGGEGLTYVNSVAFYNTPWKTNAESSASVVYLGHVAFCGRGVSGDVTITDCTVNIACEAFRGNTAITSVTIPASVTSIVTRAFYDCTALKTVNVLGATPSALGSYAFYLEGDNKSLARTFNVRSADYKTAGGWKDIYNKENEYSGYTGTELRVVSTLALPAGVTASVANAAYKVTAYGTDYYAEDADVTLSGLGAEHDAGGITYRSRATVSYGTDQTINLDADPSTGQASFTMPAADASVTAEDYPYAVKYIDENGTERSKPYADVTFIQNGSGQKLGSSANDEKWYAVSGDVTANGTLTIQDKSVHLILCDGATLNASSVNNGISIDYGLTIYAQSGGTGSITARNSMNNIHAIRVGSGLTINGGSVSATGKYGILADGGVTINGGSVTANGSSYGINTSGNVTINGGTVSATSTSYSGINAGSTVTINGGTVTATGRDGISGSIVTINGGNVTATGGNYGINVSSTITLGWTSATDRITASSYGRNPVVKSGQSLYDGTTAYSGTVDRITIAGKTLVPYIESTFAADGTAILYDNDTGLPVGSKNADRIAALATDGQPHDIALLGRTLYRDGDWNTLCLPFDVMLALDMDNVKTNENHVFHGATVMRFDTSQWYDSEGYNYPEAADGRHRSGQVDADGSLYLYFSPEMDVNDFQGDFNAGNPYIVKWGTKDSHPATNIVNPVFHGVTVTATTPIFDTTEEGRDPAALEAYYDDPEHTPYPYGNVTFRGTFAPEPIYASPATNLFLGAQNTLYWPSTDGYTIGAFRAYFALANGLTCGTPTSQVRAFSLGFGEEETTGISDATRLNNKEEIINNSWYTLDGVRLDGQPTKKGLYIHGGRKVVIK